jgi:cytosine/adenosine deaminase-related metal-dependent hydrolase
MTTLYCAKWVLPISSPPIEDGVVAVESDRIADVGPHDDVAKMFPTAGRRDFGEAAILPGLVNCHAHLELTALRGYLEPEEGDFFSWLRKLTVARLERMTPDDLYVSAAWGAIEAARAGITCIGDASDNASLSMQAMRATGLRGIVYQESFGPEPASSSENLKTLRDRIAELRTSDDKLVRVGVSPHAPYTVSGKQLELIADYALSESLPVMMHAAESLDEELFLREGRGAFAEGLRRRGIEWKAPGVSTVEYLSACGILRTRPLLAHCIRVDAGDIDLLKEADARVAHCPKSNAKLGHGRAPYSNFLSQGIKVGLGSDSVASNNTCDILEEARFATLMSRAVGDKLAAGGMVQADDVLRSATLGGAAALGLDDKIGALAKGLQADLIAVSLAQAHEVPVYEPVAGLVFSSSGRDVLLTMVAGREIYSEGHVCSADEDSLRARMKELAQRIARRSRSALSTGSSKNAEGVSTPPI